MPLVVDVVVGIVEIAGEAAVGLSEPVGEVAIVVAPQDSK
jgi:hypothetical protein